MVRRTALLLCGLLILFGGCSEVIDGESPTPTDDVTPAPVPDEGVLAPGLSPGGVDAPALLGDAHVDFLADRSYALVADRTVRYENGSLRSHLRVEVAVDENGTYLARAETAGPAAPVFLGRPPANATYWSNGTVYVRKLTRDGRTTHNAFDPPSGGAATASYWTNTVPFGGRQATASSFYRGVFASIPVRVEERRVDGEAIYRLVGDRAGENAVREGVTDVRDVRLVASVTERGFVRSLTLRYAGTIDGETVAVDRTVRYRGVGETAVERPAWFERAVGGQSTADGTS